MKRLVSVAVVLMAVLALAGEGLADPAAWPGWHRMGGGPGVGPGAMGPWMGRGGMMRGQADGWNCPMAAGATASELKAVTPERAKELAQEYADKYLAGYTVERVLPFTMPRGTMYSVELKGPDGQLRTFHVNPWGNVMPFGGAGRRAG
jgi:hypothetical protein